MVFDETGHPTIVYTVCFSELFTYTQRLMVKCVDLNGYEAGVCGDTFVGTRSDNLPILSVPFLVTEMVPSSRTERSIEDYVLIPNDFISLRRIYWS